MIYYYYYDCEKLTKSVQGFSCDGFAQAIFITFWFEVVSKSYNPLITNLKKNPVIHDEAWNIELLVL